MNDRLAAICAYKREEVAAARTAVEPARLADAVANASPPRGFERALRDARSGGRRGLIAEIKKASPSRGLIRDDFDPAAHARAYEAGGAACLSVLTDGPSFQGSPKALRAARAACGLPVLRKDFMVDPWQVDEARAMEADAILIIVAAIDDPTMIAIEARARALDMDVLVEVHDEGELARALRCLSSRLIGINNRDLRSFETDLGTSVRLARLLPPDVLPVAESGIAGPDDCAMLEAEGISTFLVGEALMRQADLTRAVRALVDRNPG